MTKILKLDLRAMGRIGFAVAIALLVAILFLDQSLAPRASAAELIGSTLGVGSRGSEVTKLQQFLATNSRIYPAGIVSGTYGPLTRDAVVQFQASYDIPQVGRVGPMTLAKINSIIASGYGLDIDASTISNMSVQVDRTTATLSWSTNENARARVYYDTAPIQSNETSVHQVMPFVSGTLAVNDGVARTSQIVNVSGLQPNTVYFYLVEAIDLSGNVTMTLPGSFQTKP